MRKGFRAILIIFVFILVVAFSVSFFRNTVFYEDLEDLQSTQIIQAVDLYKKEATIRLSEVEQANLRLLITESLQIFHKHLSKSDYLGLAKILNKYKTPPQILKTDVAYVLDLWNKILAKVNSEEKKQLIGHVSLIQKVIPDPTLGQSVVCLLFLNPFEQE